MAEPLTHHCPRCAGAEGIPGELLLDGEARVVLDLSRDYVACPTCTPFGPFGLVPAASAIEVALIEQTKKRTHKQQQHAAWMKWMME